MSGLEVPVDEWAEEVVVGVAVASQHGSALAHSRLNPTDLHAPVLRALFRAARVQTDVRSVADRVDRVAAETGVARSVVQQVVDDLPVMWDSSGGYASRVLAAAWRRRLLAELATLYEAIARGAATIEVVEALRRCVAVAEGERVGVLAEVQRVTQ